MTADLLRDLTDDEARAALLKWAAVPPGAIPAWVAEMDYAPPQQVTDAVVAAVRAGRTAYAHTSATDAEGDGSDTDVVARAFAGFAARRWPSGDPASLGWTPTTAATTLAGDVTAALRIVFRHLVPAGPVVVPTPCYPPFLAFLDLVGREVVTIPTDPDATRVGLDLDRVEAAFAAGARGLLLCSPHNPLGRAWTRGELTDLARLAERHGARVVADEVHGPLTLPGATFTPYLDVDPRGVAVGSASKTFNVPGLRCAFVSAPADGDTARLRALPTAENDGPSRLGVAAAEAAFTHGDAWLDALLVRLDAQRTQLGDLLAAHLPQARWRPFEATYLAWLDLRAYGVADPAAAARAAGAWPAPGHDYAPGLDGHVRLNVATTPERLEQLVVRIARGLGA
ncbi:aminotransferase class I/II-fold pyridoxal phosphate-dependent enzyme [Nocardioides zeae]|uniref:cysteine-S-conjugate beta-lyase n=1 Tax=Nocardioides imazamoxiresistens TaxID=3231893 RepID=A0ABU3PV17_9ACTN|nr:aminotransferase class I/II-fold pyridoxal phosphate-dependent enzyme [Nocardioides zeae]MDT9593056.1 aminotransferase class I/II-fold pyridoxal phosphate-dependent enzyme [Nocardioides zeae]